MKMSNRVLRIWGIFLFCIATSSTTVAQENLVELIKKTEPSGEELYSNGLSFFVAKDYKKAITYCEKAVKIDPGCANAYFIIGVSQVMLGRDAEAIVACKQAICIRPDFAEAHYYLGDSYYNLRRYTEAIDAYRQAIRIKPDIGEAHYNLGNSCYKLGRYTEAIDAYKQTIRTMPDFAEAHLFLGLSYIRTRDKDLAFEEYRILKDLNKDLANKLLNVISKE